jgi:response regulator RpfG family c-di-GMP phosphodiesterase
MVVPDTKMSDPLRSSENPLVLCVDDDISVLSALSRLLRGEPYRIHTALDAPTALAWMDSHPVRAIIADERMPGMSGSDLLREVRLRSPRTGRVILTGYPAHEVMHRSLQSGVDYLISKPWDDEALRSMVRKLVREGAPAHPEDPDPSSETARFDIGGEGG